MMCAPHVSRTALRVICLTGLLMLACTTIPDPKGEKGKGKTKACLTGDHAALEMIVGFDFSVFPVSYVEPTPVSGMLGVLVPTSWQLQSIQSTNESTGAPVVIAGQTLAWTQSGTVQSAIQAVHPAPSGKKWIGFSSNGFTQLPSNGPYSVRSALDFSGAASTGTTGIGFFLGDSKHRISLFRELSAGSGCSQASLPGVSVPSLVALILLLSASLYLTRRRVSR